MAARVLSMVAACAPASRLWLHQEVVDAGSSKEFSGVCWSSRGGARYGLRVNAAARRDVAAFAGKRNTVPPRTGRRPSRGSGTPSRKIQKSQRVEDDDDDAAAEAALEALFAQLEKDLELDDDDDDDGLEFTGEELDSLANELKAAFSGIEELDSDDETEEEERSGFVDMAMTDGVYGQASAAVVKGDTQKSHEQDDDEDDEYDEEEEEGGEDKDEEEQRMVPLEKWQLRKLATAAEKGRRKVNVKSLAAELGMDRSDVLSFLQNPPPELLLMSATLESKDEEDSKSSETQIEKVPRIATAQKQSVSPPAPSGGPRGSRDWHGNKRLRKEHVATFERVYRQTKRPSNAMIENLVNLTHVPRKKILQWFDDRRAENQPKKASFGDAPEN